MAEHKLAELLRYAADNEDAKFEFQDNIGQWRTLFWESGRHVEASIAHVLSRLDYTWRIYQPPELPELDGVEYANDYADYAGVWHKDLAICNREVVSRSRTGILRRTINGETGKASVCYVNEKGEEV